MEDHIKNVQVSLKTNAGLKIIGESVKTATFKRAGDEIVNFKVAVQEGSPIGELSVNATSGTEKAHSDIEFNIENPNPMSSVKYSKSIEKEGVFTIDFEAFGELNSNTIDVEFSNFPSINLSGRLAYLIGYPYGCLEQTTSKAFPQLYLPKIVDLPEKKQNEVQYNINEALKKLATFQQATGGLSYWPYSSYYESWAEVYAAHFIIEAEANPSVGAFEGLALVFYSEGKKKESIKYFEKAIKNFGERNKLDNESFKANFLKFPPYSNDYGSYSFKAIKKLLPLMRRGKYWTENDITAIAKERVENIMERVYALNLTENSTKKQINDALEKEKVADDDIPTQLIRSFIPFINKNPLKALNTYQVCYVIYDRHSEASDIKQWKTPKDIDAFLADFKQHSLKNPIVEQVVTETLRTVRDIWTHFGNGSEHFFTEIHIELGREMKNSAKKREQLSKRNSINENTNYRIKEVLKEMMVDTEIEGDIRPFSPSHQEILKIYEEGVYQNIENVAEDIEKIRKNNAPTKSEINKYKLWLEQGYVSPYTGKMIPLSKLFTTDFEIEHIIPQSRYFDNSMSNKIICESEVNRQKDNKTAYEFLKDEGGSIVELSHGRNVKLLSIAEYEEHCNKYFRNNRNKLKNLLSEDIPEGFINRQLNDSRYISKLINNLLSNIVREDNEREATSKNIVPVTGSITSKLKQDWGLNDKWNEIIAPRFERLNKMMTKDGETLRSDFGYWDNKDGKRFFRTQVPDAIAKGFNKKRIDHRHHALDAIVIACCTKKHTNYLGSLNSESKNYALRDALLIKNENGHYTKHFQQPWKNFTNDTKNILDTTIISFKQNLRVINKTNNKTWQWQEKDGKLKKQKVKQTKGKNWAIRKPMHKETVSGNVSIKQEKKGLSSLNNFIENWNMIIDKNIRYKIKNLNKVFNKDVKAIKKHLKEHPLKVNDKKIDKIRVYEFVDAKATRTLLTEKFTRKQLEKITDSGIRKILENHIKNFITTKNGKQIEQFDLAFSHEGIEVLNKNIKALNNGKHHQPIRKVRLYEVGSKFPVGEKGNKKDKFVEAAKGTNLFFAIYWDEENKKRVYETIPLNDVIIHQKWRATLEKEEMKATPMIPTKNEINGNVVNFLFSLSPNDLVYVPNETEIDNPNLVDFKNLSKEQVGNIYSVNDFSGPTCNFTPNTLALHIRENEVDIKWNSKKKRFTGHNTKTTTLNGIQIKEICWKMKSNRLGNITNVIR